MSSLKFGPARGPVPRRWTCCIVAVFALLVFSSSAGAEISPGWGKWWLPPDRSAHGHAIDSLFTWIFWITMVTFVAVEAVLVIFLIKYRSRPGVKKAHFTHGNARLEMCWTIAPAIILALLALGSKQAWDKFRYSEIRNDPNRAKILVIGQQFKWNFIYPGPDGKFGRYLIFPRPTDAKWPVGPEGQAVTFDGVPGPASLAYEKAVASINKYIDSENPLGKDFADPDGKDDDWSKQPGRGLVLPVNRPIEIQLSSKDVIHDFFLANFRVKLDAVPGMRGHIYFTATMTSAQRAQAAARTVPLEQLSSQLDSGGKAMTIIIDESAPGTPQNKNRDATGWRYINPAQPRTSIMRNGMPFNPDPSARAQQIERLKAIGLTEVRVTSDSGEWELVCEELCGQGHNTMTALVTVLSPEEYDRRKLDIPAAPPPPAPAVAATN